MTVTDGACAYQPAISDFAVEGAAVANTAANARRDQALAMLEAQDNGLAVSFTLPVLPSGLSPDGASAAGWRGRLSPSSGRPPRLGRGGRGGAGAAGRGGASRQRGRGCSASPGQVFAGFAKQAEVC